MPKTVAISGGFDPLTIGHMRYIEAASHLADRLIVIVNTDEFLLKKKNYIFMPFQERVEILNGIIYINKVLPCIDKDNTVCRSLDRLRPDIFAKGGDRTEDNIPEKDICNKLGIKVVYGVGGSDKPQSQLSAEK